MKSQTADLAKVLKTTIHTLGLSLREVERRLKLSRGYLTRLFGGEMDLKVDHVVEIAEVIGIPPEELFQLAFPVVPRASTPEVARLRETFGVNAPAVQPEGASAIEREIEQMVNRALSKAFAKFEK
jgi:transcriptional regulator with XRE-family HTH domain